MGLVLHLVRHFGIVDSGASGFSSTVLRLSQPCMTLGLVLWKSPRQRLRTLSDPHPALLWQSGQCPHPVAMVIVFLKELINISGIPTLELVNSPSEVDWSVSFYPLIALLG